MKRIYTFAAALLFLGACTSDGYTIRGNVEGLESPYVYLITFNGTHNVADSAKVEAGAFTFTGKTELPEVAYLSRDKEQPFVRFFLENARISIDGNLYNPNEVYPTGTAANEAMNAFNELTFNTSEAYGVTELEADKKQLVDRYKQQMRETIDRNRDNICGMIILAETGSMFFTPQEVLAEIDRFARLRRGEHPVEFPDPLLRRPDRRRTAARQGPRREARRAVGEITGDGRPEAMCLRPAATGSAATCGPGSNNICAPTWDNPTATSRRRHPQATRCRCGRRWRTRPTSACSSISGLRGAAPA